MRRLRLFLFALTLCLLLPSVSHADPPARFEKRETSSRPKIAVADFRGSDPEISRFLTETIISNLASSSALNPLDRPMVRRAIVAEAADAELEPTLDEIRLAGKRLHAAYFITGSYLIQDEKIMLLAHIHDLNDEEVAGVRINLTGDRADILGAAGQITDQIKERLPVHEEVRPLPPIVEKAPVVVAEDELSGLRRMGLCPAEVSPNTVLTESDLARLLSRLAENALVHPNFSLPRNGTPAPRMLALTGLVKLMLTPEQVADYRKSPPPDLPSDFARLPLWGQPFLAAASDRGWWAAARPFHPTGTANWAFIALLTRNMGFVDPPRPPKREIERPRVIEEDNEIYTGLVVDAHDLAIERSQAPDVLDEDGNHIYPYEKHAPDADYVNENGMVDYNFEVGEQTRAGRHPLVVQALRVSGGFRDDLIISNEDAERIRRAQKRSHFLWQWKVVFLIPKTP